MIVLTYVTRVSPNEHPAQRTLDALYSHRMVALQQSRIVADGVPGAVLTPTPLEQVFGMRANIRGRPREWRPHLPYVLVQASGGPDGAR